MLNDKVFLPWPDPWLSAMTFIASAQARNKDGVGGCVSQLGWFLVHPVLTFDVVCLA